MDLFFTVFQKIVTAVFQFFSCQILNYLIMHLFYIFPWEYQCITNELQILCTKRKIKYKGIPIHCLYKLFLASPRVDNGQKKCTMLFLLCIQQFILPKLFVVLQIINFDNVQEAVRETEGYFIKSGIVTVIKDALIPSGTII